MPTTAGPTRSTTRTTASEYASRRRESSARASGVREGPLPERPSGSSTERARGFMAGGRAHPVGRGKRGARGGRGSRARSGGGRNAPGGWGTQQEGRGGGGRRAP